MNRIRNRVISWLLAASMILASAPATAHAEVLHRFQHVMKPSATSGQWINPQYATLLPEPQKDVLVRTEAPVVTIDDVRLTLEEAAAELREGMVARLDNIAITFSVNAEFDATNIWDEALRHTGNPKEGDYLLGQLSSYGFSAYYNEIGEEAYFTYVFKPGYFTTAQQEQEMDAAIDALLVELNLDDATDYEKIRGIYDWICSNVTYDYENLHDKNYYLKHSAYAAMINGTAVCQGYAVLFYRLALELGVDCRYITGTGNGGAHAWNIVKLGSLYYNLDATWDQALHEKGQDYAYFLRCGANFEDHARDDEYNAAEFYQQYPMSPEDYGTDISWPVSGTCGDQLTWVLDAQGTLTISGSGNMYDFYADDPQWQQYAFHISKIVVGPEVQSVGAFAFYYCANLKQVEIQGSTVLCESSFSCCASLEQVSMPNVLAISDAVFYGCYALRAVHLPASLQSLGNEVFFDCIVLQNITVDSSNQYYTAQNNVLFNKDMTHLYTAASMMGQIYAIPDGVKQISPYAFRCNGQLQFVTVPDSVTALPEGVFYGCTALLNVTMGKKVEQIGDFAFYGCSSLEQVQLSSGLKEIRDYAFGNTALTEITIPASVTAIGHGAFEHSSIAKITFTGPAPVIGDDAFGNVFADVYYPSPNCDATWNDMTWDYGGFLQWYPTESHSYRPTVTPADCVNGGFTTYTCGCGHSYVADHTEPAGHSWDEGTVTQQPTDTVPGKRTYTCIACNATYVEDIPPTSHEHKYSSTVTPPTCTQDGYTTHTCSDCGYSVIDNVVAATGHKLGQWELTKAPACEIAGEESSSCTVCGELQVRSVDPLQHSFTNYISDGNAACGVDGTKTAVCDHGCGAKDTVTDTGSAKAHNYNSVVTAPTCTEEGYTTHTCSICNHSYTDNKAPATGHSMGAWEQTKAPACEVTGEETSRCAVCDHVQTRPVDALQHSFTEYVSDGNATCGVDGTKSAVCDHGCGKKDTLTDSGSALEHDMGQWQIISAATAEKEGLKRRTCNRCTHAEEQVIPLATGPQDITSDVYAISGETIGAIAAGTTVTQFLTGIHEADFIQVVKDGNQVAPDNLIATGMEVQLVVSEQVVKKLTVVVTGDINGDGDITLSDMLMVKSHLLGKTTLAGTAALSADTNDDKGISITDFLQIKAHILGKNNIKPHA